MKKNIITQVYEIVEQAEAAQLAAAGVDHIGSVAFLQDKRHNQAIREMFRFLKNTGAGSSLIPLFNDEDEIFRTLDYLQPDIVHFCEFIPLNVKKADETKIVRDKLILRQMAVKEKFPGIKIMRSLPIPAAGTSGEESTAISILELGRLFAPCSDYYLTDTILNMDLPDAAARQPVADFVGITGKTCDWAIAARLVAATAVPVILAGGIGPENVYNGIMQVCPAGVDSCTKTNLLDAEGKPVRFKKDMAKVRRLIAETKRAEIKLNQ
ncbi:MAG TPA: hypothetical protein PKZ12_00525 [Smithellaceae bacterium]|nr:hypothetical protein [Smithellaceae bacterium]